MNIMLRRSTKLTVSLTRRFALPHTHVCSLAGPALHLLSAALCPSHCHFVAHHCMMSPTCPPHLILYVSLTSHSICLSMPHLTLSMSQYASPHTLCVSHLIRAVSVCLASRSLCLRMPHLTLYDCVSHLTLSMSQGASPRTLDFTTSHCRSA